ncbi:MAG: hypothetical protein LUH05_04895 [Candidatus Gastranaerophilales bacterium]|nr:hypothetical protein [Candidatus Gastranaerophilales bacterium]
MAETQLDKYYNELITYDWFTVEELDLVTKINGYNEQTLNDCLYARYGLHNYKQFKTEINRD